jgi:hypothetical protein
VGLERGALSLVSTTVELLDRKVAALVYKIENMAVGFHVAPSTAKVGNQPTSGGRSVGVVRSRTPTMDLKLKFKANLNYWGMHPVARLSIKYQNSNCL